jgi:hypothetical protein
MLSAFLDMPHSSAYLFVIVGSILNLSARFWLPFQESLNALLCIYLSEYWEGRKYFSWKLQPLLYKYFTLCSFSLYNMNLYVIFTEVKKPDKLNI